MLEKDDNGVGMELQLRMKVPGELACNALGPDGSDECRIAFAVNKYMTGEKGSQLNSAIVWMVYVFFT
jgi:hypothetical protein